MPSPTNKDVDAARRFFETQAALPYSLICRWTKHDEATVSDEHDLAALLAQTREAERERCIKECAEAVERLWAGDAEIPFREAVVDMLNDMLVQRPEAEK